jgi:type IV secretory pathway VirB4 component
LGSGWTLFVEASRQPAERYPDSNFPDEASGLVDAERRSQFEAEGAHFDSAYVLTFVWMPPADDASRARVGCTRAVRIGGAPRATTSISSSIAPTAS